MSINIHHNGCNWYLTQLRYHESSFIKSLWFAYRDDGTSLHHESLDSLLHQIQSYHQ